MHTTPEVRRARHLAHYEAEQLHHQEITIAHFILGLLHAEDEVDRHLLRDLSFEPPKVQQLIESLPTSHQHPPADIHLSSAVQRIWDLGFEQADRRNHTYLGVEHLLLALALDQAGGDILRQLEISPAQIRDQMERLLLETPATVPEERLSLEEFMTPALTTDLKKILAKCRYPLYILVNQSQAFRLCGSDFGINNGVLNNISFGFARPFCFAAFHDLKRLQLVRIGNWGKNAFGKRRAWLTWTNFQPRMISEGLLQPPTEFQGLLGAPGGAIDLARWEQLFAETAWEPYSGSGLHFNMAYWDGEQVPVGWAYSAEEEPLVVVAALGVPRSDFLEVLQSLVILHQNDEPLIGNFQEEMRTAMEEFGRNRRRKSQ